MKKEASLPYMYGIFITVYEFGLESRENCRRDPSRSPRGTLFPQNLALTSPISGGCSVGIVRSRTQATEVFFFSTQIGENCITRSFVICILRQVHIIRIIKSRMRWASHVTRMGEKRNAYRLLVGKPEGKNHYEDQDVGG
jgi:hypothetical protein